jgi:DNA repair protein RecN (Recombination protein N)
MLLRLYIKNIALIEEADIEFGEKLNILSGETGAGKSVILESINFVLGSKADKTLIRYGEKEALVKAEFAVSESSVAAQKLAEMDIETDGTISISRKLSADGKGSIKINGNNVTVSMLKTITQNLVDVHGQSEHFLLLNEANQLALLDSLCGEPLAAKKQQLSVLLAEKKGYKQQISLLGGNEEERERKLDLLGYQINEIDKADIQVGEFESLKAKQNIIANVEKIAGAVGAAKEILSADGGVTDQISSAKRYMGTILHLDEKYAELNDRMEGLLSEADDIAETLSDMEEDLSFDENEAQFVDERLTLLKSLKKKYGADEETILAFRNTAKAQYDSLLDSANTLEKLQKSIQKCDDSLFELCQEMTKIRQNCANSFCKNVENELHSLNIPHAKFVVNFTPYTRETANLNSQLGSDRIEFAFSANKGEPLKPLGKVISGGEMSRFMLALKTQFKQLNGISTYIFDEIDTGISGVTAKAVAEKFVAIARDTQIIAVSHLPQICAASNHHFLISKKEKDGKTITQICPLNAEEKVNEIIRLTGSVGGSESAKEYAKELIKQFETV